MTGNQMYVKLLSMRDEVGKRHYERIKLAKALLEDKEWVESQSGGGGDEGQAIDRIEDNCFGDLCGAMGLPQLIELLVAYPNEEDWVSERFNFRDMYSAMKERERLKKPKVYKRPEGARGITLTASAAEFFNKPLYRQQQTFVKIEQQMETQAERIIRLEEENRQLKDRVRELERQFKTVMENVR